MADFINPMFGDDSEDATDDWVPAEALNRLNQEHAMLYGDETLEQASSRMMKESLPLVTAGVIHTALHSPDSRVRLQASGMIMDRVLGKAGTPAQDDDILEVLTSDLMSGVEKLLTAQAAE